MQKLFVAGATGYLGGYLVETAVTRGLQVTALTRSARHAPRFAALGAAVFEAEATRPDTLHGGLDGHDTVVSALGITRQKDGLSYMDVDYQANLNLLRAAEQAGVETFVYVGVFQGEALAPHSAMVAAKERFVHALRRSPLRTVVVRPTGFFSDLSVYLEMATRGTAWVFGDGAQTLNPIHGADLAAAVLDSARRAAPGCPEVNVGGPEVLSMTAIAEAAFAALGKPPRIRRVPQWLLSVAAKVFPYVTPQSVYGPAQMFLAASTLPMVAPAHGTHTLGAFYRAQAAKGARRHMGASLEAP